VRGLENSSLYGETFFLLAGRWVLPIGGYCMVVQGIHQRWLLVAISRSQESNNIDKTLKLDSLELSDIPCIRFIDVNWCIHVVFC
jgi:hypothetical protein